MIKDVLKVAGGAIAGGAIVAALTWTGADNLKRAEQKAEEFKNAAIQFVEDARAMEKHYQSVSDENFLLNEKIEELETIVDYLSEENEYQWKQAKQYKTELNKANGELEKANKDAAEHEQAISEILDTSIFENKADIH